MNAHAHFKDEEQTESYHVRRNRLSSDLLLARLCRSHPEEARRALKGYRPLVKDDVDPPLTQIVVNQIKIVAAPPVEAAEPKPERKRQPKPTLVPTSNVIVLPVENTRGAPEETPDPKPTIKMIINEVAAFYELPSDDLRSASRQLFIIKPRHIAMYLCREMTLNSFPQISRQFGDRDHTSALYAWCKISACIGSTRGDYTEHHKKAKFTSVVRPDERVRDEVEIIKLRVRQALLDSNPETAHATPPRY